MAKKQFNSLGFMLKKMAAVTVYLISELAESVQEALTEFGASGTNHAPGLVPDPGSTQGNTKYLREDGTWAVPAGLDISGKEDKMGIIAVVDTVDATLPVSSLTCETDKYYRLDVPVETLAVTLPEMSNVTVVKTVVLYLTGGTTPAVTISSTAPSGGTAPAVHFSDGYAIESGNTYEVNCAWNGLAWIVASFKINTSNS